MILPIPSLWFSYINKKPDGIPNDGVFIIDTLAPIPGSGDLTVTGNHFRLKKVGLTGTYTPATAGALDRIEFSEPEEGTNCTLTYWGDMTPDGSGGLQAVGKRRRTCPTPPSPDTAPAAALADDDWVGTHGT
jgi:hypothetical protein